MNSIKPKINVIIFITYVILISCNENNNYSQLLEKYKELQKKYDHLNSYIYSIEFRPKVISKSNRIKLGEEYEANIFLAVVDSASPPITIFGNIDTLSQDFAPRDTLEYNSKFNSSIYKNVPNKRGKYKWKTKIYYIWNKKEYQYFTGVTYEVY